MPFDATKPPVSSPLLSVLIEGRRRIESNWRQDGMGCAVSAISQQHVGALIDLALKALARAIYDSDNTNGIVPWNDAKYPDGSPARTQQDVLDAYDTAIAREITNAIVECYR